MEEILKTTELTKHYGHKAVVNRISMTINRGEVYGFIGENGAGKTTFMRLVLGMALPDSGTVSLFGGEAAKTAGQKTGGIIEAPALYGNCSAYENLKRMSMLSGRGTGSITDDRTLYDLIDVVGLTDAGNKKAGHYSLGMKQRLGLAVAMLGDPEFLVLDEPVNGLDPAGIKDIRDTIQRLNKERGVTFLISSHLLDELSKTVSKYGIIHEGVLVEEITANELAEKARQSISVTVDDPARAVRILSDKIKAEDIAVDGDVLRIYHHPGEAAAINALLVGEGIAVSGLGTQSFSIENYFIERMRS